MNPDDEPTSQPPDSLEIIDDEVVIDKTLKKKTTTFETPNNTPTFSENEETNEQNKNQEKHPNTDVITLRSPVLPEAFSSDFLYVILIFSPFFLLFLILLYVPGLRIGCAFY